MIMKLTMGKIEIVDTWQEFLNYWRKAYSKSIDEQVAL
jgi:hypothetical protein